MIQSISYHLDDSELDFNVQNSCGSISKYAGFLLNFWWFSGNHFDTAQVLSKNYNSRSQLSQLKTTSRKIEIVEINTHFLQIVRVPSSNTANFTKISQNMPTFQSLLTKATRPKAKFYNIYMVAYGPNHVKFQYLRSCQAYIAQLGHYPTSHFVLEPLGVPN